MSLAESMDRRTRKPPQTLLSNNHTNKVMLVPKALLNTESAKQKEN